jgi:hypothetical protein
MKRNYVEILPTSEARSLLSSTVSRFRKEGISAAPLLFGNHRRPEGVVLPFELFEKLLPEIDDILLTERIRARLAEGAESLPLEQLIEELGFKNSDFEN